jgi:RNA polymerase sigma-70 factor (ECF subfamily)
LTEQTLETYHAITVTEELREEDRRLVSALKRGEEAAFELLVRLHQHRVYGLCLRMLADRAEAEDLAQEVFISVFRNIQTFREESLLSTWIYRITRNHCLNRLKFLRRRAHERQQPLEDTRQADLAGESLADPVAGSRLQRPDRAIEGRELESRVLQELAGMSEDHRELVVLRDLEQLTYEEIQDITGLAEGTVKSRLHRARMELARRMAPHLKDS